MPRKKATTIPPKKPPIQEAIPEAARTAAPPSPAPPTTPPAPTVVIPKPPTPPPDAVTKGVAEEIEKFQAAMNLSVVFSPPGPAVPTDQAVVAWNAVATLKDIFEAQLALWREHLMNVTAQQGAQTDQGGQQLDVNGTRLIRERRRAKLPDEQSVKELLARNSLPINECFDEVKTLVLNPSKLDYLIQSGRISEEQVEALKKVTWAFKVKPSELLDNLLERLRMAFNVAPRKKLHD